MLDGRIAADSGEAGERLMARLRAGQEQGR